MKYFNVLYVGLMTFLIGFSSYGMDSLSESSLEIPSFPDLSQSSLHYPEEPSTSTRPFSFALSGGGAPVQTTKETYEPVSDENFIKFHRLVNEYQSGDSRLTFNIGLHLLRDKIGIIPSLKILGENEKYNNHQINNMKHKANEEYFAKYPADLCKSLPFFLDDIEKHGKFAKRDVLSVLEFLTAKHPEEHLLIGTVKKTVETSRAWDAYLTGQCLNTLNPICKFYPQRLFENACFRLVNDLLPGLKTKDIEQLHELRKKIVSNIDTMIECVQIKKKTSESFSIKLLHEIKESIQINSAFDQNTIGKLIQDLHDINTLFTEPDISLESSSLQHQDILQKREQEVLNNPANIITSVLQSSWTPEIKIYALQLMFWDAQEKNDLALEIKLIQALKTFEEKAPKIVHQRGTKKYPLFTYNIDKLPQDAPPSLLSLFENFKKEERIRSIYDPKLAIETYEKDIKDIEDFLVDEKNIKYMADKAAKFRGKHVLSNRTPEEIEQTLKREFAQELSEGKITEAELNKLIEQSKKFYTSPRKREVGSTKNAADIPVVTLDDKSYLTKKLSSEHETRIRTKIESTLKQKQKELAALALPQNEISAVKEDIPQISIIEKSKPIELLPYPFSNEQSLIASSFDTINRAIIMDKIQGKELLKKAIDTFRTEIGTLTLFDRNRKSEDIANEYFTKPNDLKAEMQKVYKTISSTYVCHSIPFFLNKISEYQAHHDDISKKLLEITTADLLGFIKEQTMINQHLNSSTELRQDIISRELNPETMQAYLLLLNSACRFYPDLAPETKKQQTSRTIQKEIMPQINSIVNDLIHIIASTYKQDRSKYSDLDTLFKTTIEKLNSLTSVGPLLLETSQVAHIPADQLETYMAKIELLKQSIIPNSFVKTKLGEVLTDINAEIRKRSKHSIELQQEIIPSRTDEIALEEFPMVNWEGVNPQIPSIEPENPINPESISAKAPQIPLNPEESKSIVKPKFQPINPLKQEDDETENLERLPWGRKFVSKLETIKTEVSNKSIEQLKESIDDLKGYLPTTSRGVLQITAQGKSDTYKKIIETLHTYIQELAKKEKSELQKDTLPIDYFKEISSQIQLFEAVSREIIDKNSENYMKIENIITLYHEMIKTGIQLLKEKISEIESFKQIDMVNSYLGGDNILEPYLNEILSQINGKSYNFQSVAISPALTTSVVEQQPITSIIPTPPPSTVTPTVSVIPPSTAMDNPQQTNGPLAALTSKELDNTGITIENQTPPPVEEPKSQPSFLSRAWNGIKSVWNSFWAYFGYIG